MGTASLEDSKKAGLVVEEGVCVCRGGGEVAMTAGNQVAESRCDRTVEEFENT